MSIWEYSTSASSNGNVSGISMAEGIAPSVLNDGVRKLMADLAEFVELYGGTLTTAGSANSQTLSPTIAWTQYDNGRRLLVKIGNGLTNTGAATLNVSSLGAKSIVKRDGATALTAGDLVAGSVYELKYDATAGAFRLLTGGISLDDVTAAGSDVASAATVDLDAATGGIVAITGTTTITAVTLAAGNFRFVRFTGALTLTHGASLILPGGANITTADGDFAIFVGYASSVVRCLHYQRAASEPLAFASQAQMETATSNVVAVTPGRAQYHPGVAKAWAVFAGDGAPISAAASHNVSSITDNGTADYTINLTTAFSSADYVVTATAQEQAANSIIVSVASDAGAIAAGSFRLVCQRWEGFVLDSTIRCVAFGDQ